MALQPSLSEIVTRVSNWFPEKGRGGGFIVPTPKEADLTQKEKSEERGLDKGHGILFVTLKDDGSAIFKSVTTEVDFGRNGIKPGSYYKRERATYLVSSFINCGCLTI